MSISHEPYTTRSSVGPGSPKRNISGYVDEERIPSTKEAVKKLFDLFLPSFGGSSINNVGTLVSSWVILRASPSDFADFVLASSLGQCMCLSIGYGLMGALDTLCAQACGAGNFKLAGVWLHRARVINILLWLPTFCLMFFANVILKNVGVIDDEKSLHDVRVLCILFGFGYFFSFQFEGHRRFLNAINRPSPTMYATVAGTCMHVCVLFLCFNFLNLGSKSGAIAFIFGQITQWLVLEVYFYLQMRKNIIPKIPQPNQIYTGDNHKTLSEPLLGSLPLAFMEISSNIQKKNSKTANPSPCCIQPSILQPCGNLESPEVQCFVPFELGPALRNWGSFFSVAGPACIMVCAEWWAFEFLTIESRALGRDQADVTGFVNQILIVSYMVPMSMATALATMVGQNIGRMHVKAARAFVAPAIGCVLIPAVLLSCTVYFGRHAVVCHMPQLNESMIMSTMPIVALYILIDMIGGTMLGVVRGLGRQKAAAIGNLTGIYGIAQPLVWVLCFSKYFKWDITGVWVAAAVGIAAQSLTMIWASFSPDWAECARQAHERRMLEEIERTESAFQNVYTMVSNECMSAPMAAFPSPYVPPLEKNLPSLQNL